MIEKIKESFYTNTKIPQSAILCPKFGNKSKVPFDEVLTYTIQGLSISDIAIKYNRKHLSLYKSLSKLMGGVKLAGGYSNWSWYLISRSDYSKCGSCKEFRLKSDFCKNKKVSTGINSTCKNCVKEYREGNKEQIKDYQNTYRINNRERYRFHNSNYYAQKTKSIPPWADLNRIKDIYDKCPEGHEVDHIFPLRGNNVCGLHVENNLQYLLKKDNRTKSNKILHEPTIIGNRVEYNPKGVI